MMIVGGGTRFFAHRAALVLGASQWDAVDALSGTTLAVTVTSMPAALAINYRVNGGSWTSSGISAPGSFNLTGLTTDTAVTVELQLASGPASDVKTRTPTLYRRRITTTNQAAVRRAANY